MTGYYPDSEPEWSWNTPEPVVDYGNRSVEQLEIDDRKIAEYIDFLDINKDDPDITRWPDCFVKKDMT